MLCSSAVWDGVIPCWRCSARVDRSSWRERSDLNLRSGSDVRTAARKWPSQSHSRPGGEAAPESASSPAAAAAAAASHSRAISASAVLSPALSASHIACARRRHCHHFHSALSASQPAIPTVLRRSHLHPACAPRSVLHRLCSARACSGSSPSPVVMSGEGVD